MAGVTARWRVHVATVDPTKLRRVSDRLSEAIGGVVVSSEPYWKVPTTSEVVLEAAAQDDEAQAILGVLRRASRLAPAWQTSGPGEYDGGRWEFEALTDRGLRVPGATWALVRVANF